MCFPVQSVVEKAHSAIPIAPLSFQLQSPGQTQPVCELRPGVAPGCLSAPEVSSGETQPKGPEETGGR